MTARFRFGLQKVLDYREHVEKQRIEALAGAINKAREEEKILESLRKEKEWAFYCLRDITSSGTTAGYLAQYNRYIKALDQHINLQMLNLSNAEREVEECRRSLERAVKDRKIIGKLKEKQYGRFAYYINREQQKEAEDLVNHNIIKA